MQVLWKETKMQVLSKELRSQLVTPFPGIIFRFMTGLELVNNSKPVMTWKIILVFLEVGTGLSRSRNQRPLFIYCESPPLNYLFTVRDIPQNDFIITSIVLPDTVYQIWAQGKGFDLINSSFYIPKRSYNLTIFWKICTKKLSYHQEVKIFCSVKGKGVGIFDYMFSWNIF